MRAYYNEIDPYAAQWLRNLIAAGHIAPGDVDERPIQEVKADDVKGYTQCHFFAGIGGWSYALRLAGWPDDRPVWTGSCPCQPFSVLGKRAKQQDGRHLWPHWSRLISESKPATLFGEQVAGAITGGWLDDAAHDLETQGYAFAAAVLPACSVGAPHKRDRLWFVANSKCEGLQGYARYGKNQTGRHTEERPASEESVCRNVAYSTSGKTDPTTKKGLHAEFDSESISGGEFMADTGLHCDGRSNWFRQWEREPQEAVRYARERGSQKDGLPVPESLLGRVAYGIPFNAYKLRAYGNAIVPQVAAEFIKAAEGCLA